MSEAIAATSCSCSVQFVPHTDVLWPHYMCKHSRKLYLPKSAQIEASHGVFRKGSMGTIFAIKCVLRLGWLPCRGRNRQPNVIMGHVFGSSSRESLGPCDTETSLGTSPGWVASSGPAKSGSGKQVLRTGVGTGSGFSVFALISSPKIQKMTIDKHAVFVSHVDFFQNSIRTNKK